MTTVADAGAVYDDFSRAVGMGATALSIALLLLVMCAIERK